LRLIYKVLKLTKGTDLYPQLTLTSMIEKYKLGDIQG